MFYQSDIYPYVLDFKKPAGTSRGIYHHHHVHYVVLCNPTNPHHFGIGECAPLPDLSCDALPTDQYQQCLHEACQQLCLTGTLDKELLRPYPSILFGLETALLHYQQRSLAFWPTPFSQGQQGIVINGLIWMGQFDSMFQQIKRKLEQGFTCIKLKIGALDFEQELALIKFIRQHFSAQDITIRVDANGAFPPDTALEKLKRLSEFELHSIEQPIKAGQWQVMAHLVEETPLAIALDEELIGWHQPQDKRHLLTTIKPHYIILKPSLHGGLMGCQEWIETAQQLNIDWWLTSALESNIGLNAIAQWAATFDNPLPQGLGTGLLYHNNIDLPLIIKGQKLFFDPNQIPTSADPETSTPNLNTFLQQIHHG